MQKITNCNGDESADSTCNQSVPSVLSYFRETGVGRVLFGLTEVITDATGRN